jgi:hypothetical protein
MTNQPPMTYQEVDEAVNAWELRGSPLWATLHDGRLVALVAGSLRQHQARTAHITDAIAAVLANIVDNVHDGGGYDPDQDDHVEELNLLEDVTVHHTLNDDGLPAIVLRFKPSPTTHNWRLRYKVTVEPVVEANWMDIVLDD